MTKPIFIVSSGRSGSALIDKVFKNFPEIESHHEYLCTHVQHLAMRKYFKLDKKKETVTKLKKIYLPAIEFSQKKYFVDSSNKLSWLIPELREIFPKSKFIFFVRNGKNVVSSFYNKLFDEAYDDESVKRIINYLKSSDHNLEPPPEKKYWWPIPLDSLENFSKIGQFERLCFYWNEVNMYIKKDLDGHIPKRDFRMLKLERFTSEKEYAKRLFNFLKVEFSNEIFEEIKVPHNVNIPKDFGLTKNQSEIFNKICHESMKIFNYDEKEYYENSYKKI